MRKLRKKYETPNHPWQKERIEEEKAILDEYGLKNKKEIWKTESKLRGFMRQAKKVVATRDEQSKKEEKQLLDKLFRMGLLPKDSQIEDVLGIDLRQLLDRRLQTIIYKQQLANTIRQARQMIVHGHVTIDGKKVSVPSYYVNINEEKLVGIHPKSNFLKEEKKTAKKEETKPADNKKSEKKKEKTEDKTEKKKVEKDAQRKEKTNTKKKTKN